MANACDTMIIFIPGSEDELRPLSDGISRLFEEVSFARGAYRGRSGMFVSKNFRGIPPGTVFRFEETESYKWKDRVADLFNLGDHGPAHPPHLETIQGFELPKGGTVHTLTRKPL